MKDDVRIVLLDGRKLAFCLLDPVLAEYFLPCRNRSQYVLGRLGLAHGHQRDLARIAAGFFGREVNSAVDVRQSGGNINGFRHSFLAPDLASPWDASIGKEKGAGKPAPLTVSRKTREVA